MPLKVISSSIGMHSTDLWVPVVWYNHSHNVLGDGQEYIQTDITVLSSVALMQVVEWRNIRVNYKRVVRYELKQKESDVQCSTFTCGNISSYN